jgi:hypothetical protein
LPDALQDNLANLLGIRLLSHNAVSRPQHVLLMRPDKLLEGKRVLIAQTLQQLVVSLFCHPPGRSFRVSSIMTRVLAILYEPK